MQSKVYRLNRPIFIHFKKGNMLQADLQRSPRAKGFNLFTS